MMIVSANMPLVLDPAINIAPTINGITYYGNAAVACDAGERSEAWSFREIILQPAVLPEQLADGTPFGEFGYYKQCLANTAAYCNALLALMPSAMYNNGFWIFTYENPNPQNIPIYPYGWGAGDGHSDPWMMAYVNKVWGYAAYLYGDDTTLGADGTQTGPNILNVVKMMRNYFAGFITGKSRTLLCGYFLSTKAGNDHTAPWRANWDQVGVMQGDFCQVYWQDLSGWVLLGQYGGIGNNWPFLPLDVGAKVVLSAAFSGTGNNPVPPAPFVAETSYYVVAADPPNFRLKLGLPNADGSFNAAAAPIVPSATNLQGIHLYQQQAPAALADGFVSQGRSPFPGRTCPALSDLSQDSYFWFWEEAVRAMRRAGIKHSALGDPLQMQQADAILRGVSTAWAPAWDRSNLKWRTFAHINL
jgi:hypothetical protein